MAHADQKLAIFRGLLKFKSNVQKLGYHFLSIVTTIEVDGIIKPEFNEHVLWDENLELDLYYFNHEANYRQDLCTFAWKVL